MAPVNKGSSVQRTHPLLYWVTIAYIVGLPNFLYFDGSGRTHDLGLLNATSISRIALSLLTAYVLAATLAMGRGPFFPRKVKVSIGVWISLLAWCTIATILQPPGRLTPPLSTDLPLSLFRLGEWVLGFILFLAVYTRTPAEEGVALVVELIGRSSWITIIMVWLMMLVAPHLAYALSDEPGSMALLGGQFVNPGILAFQAGCAFLYSLWFARQAYFKWSGCCLAFITLVMTRARTPLIGFLIALLSYVFVYCGRPMLRWAAVGLLVLFGVSFSQPILLYLARGQNAESIATLNDRVLLWTACWSAIQLRPTLGYGFIVGAKNAIKDHWSYSHWLPPHAHNDFIQATLEAGFPACLLVMYIYTWLIIKSINASRKSRGHLFILLVVAQIVVIASTGLVAASQFTTLSAVFVLCCIGSAGNDLKEPVVVTARYRDEMERAIACLPS